ncbi:MAG TPA: metallophosphoesterase [Patescibacteria group bacterium]|nr:metallophosphoesterase [Patescibacteria group bacterium]
MKKILILLAFLPFTCSAFSVGVISDLHAGGKSKKTDIDSPKKNFSYFTNALSEMKSQGVEVVAVLGDITNSGKKADYKKILKISKRFGMKMLYVKGNHDNAKFSILSPTNYIYEKDDVRFIVLDTATKCRIDGCLNTGQESFLKSNLKTDKRVIVLQHQPPLQRYNDTPLDLFDDEILVAPEIWSGHWHIPRLFKTIRVFPALSLNKKLNYSVINL